MITAYIFFAVPTLLFVVAFLYETYLSFKRLTNPKVGRTGYLSATWEVTHTLLVFAVVMLVMLFTQSIDQLAAAIFTATFLAAAALTVRAACYLYIFYVRDQKKTSWVDWLFALSHVASAVPLVVVVLQATWFIFTEHPQANLEFLPAFIPGLILVLAICILPMLSLYRTKH